MVVSRFIIENHLIRRVVVNQLVASAVDSAKRRPRANIVKPLVQEFRPVIRRKSVERRDNVIKRVSLQCGLAPGPAVKNPAEIIHRLLVVRQLAQRCIHVQPDQRRLHRKNPCCAANSPTAESRSREAAPRPPCPAASATHVPDDDRALPQRRRDARETVPASTNRCARESIVPRYCVKPSYTHSRSSFIGVL